MKPEPPAAAVDLAGFAALAGWACWPVPELWAGYVSPAGGELAALLAGALTDDRAAAAWPRSADIPTTAVLSAAIGAAAP